MKRFLFCALLACPLLLGACWNGRLLVAAEEPWWTAQRGNALMRWPILQISLAHGYLPRFLVIGAQEQPVARLQREMARRRYRVVVVGPLLSLQSGDYAPSFPSTRFLLVDDPPGAPAAQNAVRLAFDRTRAFRIAGTAAGLSVRDESGGVVSPALARRIGVLASAHPPGSGAELAAFADGVSRALDGGEPSVRRLSEPMEPNVVKSTVEEMEREGVEIFLLFMGDADPLALSAMRSAGGCAIVADWEASSIYPQQVFLSIENDLVGGISDFLAQGARAGGTVDGPVRIVAGKARAIPREVASQVAGR